MDERLNKRETRGEGWENKSVRDKGLQDRRKCVFNERGRQKAQDNKEGFELREKSAVRE